MLFSRDLKFKYSLKATKEKPSAEQTIQTPWIDEGVPLTEQIEFNLIHKDDELIIQEQLHPNGFHLLTIQKSDEIIFYTNWELDYISDEGEYLPRVQ